jgi:hypothetical protein
VSQKEKNERSTEKNERKKTSEAQKKNERSTERKKRKKKDEYKR